MQGQQQSSGVGSDDSGQLQGPPAGVAAAKAAQLTSKFTGVCWNKKNKRWQASINSGGKYLYLGSFISEVEAARVFDQAAIQLRGRDTKLNFPLEDYLDENGQASGRGMCTAVCPAVVVVVVVLFGAERDCACQTWHSARKSLKRSLTNVQTGTCSASTTKLPAKQQLTCWGRCFHSSDHFR